MLHPKYIYTCAFFLPAERERLLEKFPPKFENVFASHMTIEYKPDVQNVENLPLGSIVKMNIIGIAEDDKGQALLLDTDLSKNKFSHITLSTVKGIKPVYSNELLESGKVTKIDPFEIEMVIGFCSGSYNFSIFNPMPISTIQIPTKPQEDTLASIFLLKKFGRELFPGIEEANISINPLLEEGENALSLIKRGILPIDLGGMMFDHHGLSQKTTVTNIVAEYLGIENDPSLKKLFAFVERSDFEGKGIISDDYLDKAFGLSGILMSFNRAYSENPSMIVESLLPILEAHYVEEHKRAVELPKRFDEKKKNGNAETFSVNQGDTKMRVVIIEDDDPSMNGYLRSQKGGGYDVVVQKNSNGYTNVMTRRMTRANISHLTAVFRKTEAMLCGIEIEDDYALLSKEGRLDKLPMWYYDPITNSLLNGGINPQGISPTKIPYDKFKDLVIIGLQI